MFGYQNLTDTTYRKLFIGGLSYNTTEESLRAFFEQFGTVVEAAVITDRSTGKSKGYGFVTMSTNAQAEAACKNTSPVIDGRKTNCNLAYIGKKNQTGLAAMPGAQAVGQQTLFSMQPLPQQYGQTMAAAAFAQQFPGYGQAAPQQFGGQWPQFQQQPGQQLFAQPVMPPQTKQGQPADGTDFMQGAQVQGMYGLQQPLGQQMYGQQQFAQQPQFGQQQAQYGFGDPQFAQNAAPGMATGMSPGMAQPGMAQPGIAQPGMAQPGMAQPGMAQGIVQGMAQPGMAQPGMAQPGMAQGMVQASQQPQGSLF